MRWYYYLHTNGDLIGKNPAVVDSDASYFDSDFVRKVWLITSREKLIRMLVQAKELGARAERIKAIEEKSTVTEKDYECLRRIDAGEDQEKVVAEIFG